MAKKYLGEEIDIHAGGEDLVFPHHENEIAQSECCNGKIFSRYWLHNAFLNIDNRKMSKSLGNFFTVREISEKYDLQVLRFFMLSAHYRSPLNFSADLMESAKTGLARICNAADSLKHYAGAAKEAEMTAEEMTALEEAKNLAKKFDDAMDDDFNTADAISVVFELVRLANSNVMKTAQKHLYRVFWMNFWSLAISWDLFSRPKKRSWMKRLKTDRRASGGKKREKLPESRRDPCRTAGKRNRS